MSVSIPPALCRALAVLAEDGHAVDADAVQLLALAPGAETRTRSGWVALFLALKAVTR